jgi:hypothetical protein
MSTRRQDRTIVVVLEVSCSSRCFFGFVRNPSAFVMSFDCLLLSDVVRSFVRSLVFCRVYIRTVRSSLSLSLLVVVDNQLSSLLSTALNSTNVIFGSLLTVGLGLCGGFYGVRFGSVFGRSFGRGLVKCEFLSPQVLNQHKVV